MEKNPFERQKKSKRNQGLYLNKFMSENEILLPITTLVGDQRETKVKKIHMINSQDVSFDKLEYIPGFFSITEFNAGIQFFFQVKDFKIIL